MEQRAMRLSGWLVLGAIMVVAGLDGLLWLMVINGFQMALIAVSILVLWKLWNR